MGTGSEHVLDPLEQFGSDADAEDRPRKADQDAGHIQSPGTGPRGRVSRAGGLFAVFAS